MGKDARQLRTLTAALGIGSIAFGVAPIVAPRLFGRLFGIEAVERPQVATVIRSVGARDVAVGYGLVSAATSGQPVAPWLLARVICDTTDTVGCAIAIGEGVRHPRFLALTGFAALAAAIGAFLLQQARATSRKVLARPHPRRACGTILPPKG
jgi:hypothetical protein